MPPSDNKLRAAVFAHITRLRERYAGRIPRDELTAGSTSAASGLTSGIKEGHLQAPRPRPRRRRAQHPDLRRVALRRRAGPRLRQFIYKYRGTDPAHSDNVALRDAMRLQRLLLYLIAVDPGVHDAVFPVYVAGDDSRQLEFTLVADEAQVLAGAGVGLTDVDPVMTAARRSYPPVA
jgi:putative restriction endonuclease